MHCGNNGSLNRRILCANNDSENCLNLIIFKELSCEIQHLEMSLFAMYECVIRHLNCDNLNVIFFILFLCNLLSIIIEPVFHKIKKITDNILIINTFIHNSYSILKKLILWKTIQNFSHWKQKPKKNLKHYYNTFC